jgi:hypothetical protein
VLRLTADDSEFSISSQVTITALPPAIGLESGVVADVGSTWQTITLARSYSSPVVVCTVNYTNSELPAVARVRNASGNTFEVRVQNPSNSALAGYSVQYIAVEEGTYNETDDGIKMEAVRFDSSITDSKASWGGEERTYLNNYSNPVVVGQVMTESDSNWSVFWASGSTYRDPPSATTLKLGKHVGEDSNTDRADEVIGYIVIESGEGLLDGVPYSAAVGPRIVRGVTNGPPYAYDVTGLASGDFAVLSSAGMRGNNGGWPILYGPSPLSATQINLAYDEDQVRDSERSHNTESVSYLILGLP